MKLCPKGFLLVLLMLAIGACTSSELLNDVKTADSWAKKACNAIYRLPAASSSSLPPSVTVIVSVTPSATTAIVTSASGSN